MNAKTIKFTNGNFQVAVFVDMENLAYRGVRFDRSGVFQSLKLGDFEFLGRWTKEDDCTFHDAIRGTVEEFFPIGYDSAKVGEGFLKIGVGILKKDNDEPYDFRKKYDLIDEGVRSVKMLENGVEYTHKISASSYNLEYKKTILVDLKQNTMHIDHTIINNGDAKLSTNVYNHNFFTLSSPMSANIVVETPFVWDGDEIKGIGKYVSLNGKITKMLTAIPEGDCALIKNIKTSNSVEDYNISVKRTVGETCYSANFISNRPIAKMNFWTCTTCVCPEPFTDINVEGGKSFDWRISYKFSESKV